MFQGADPVIIDLGINGANQITELTPEQVKAILGSGTGSLTIQGSADDMVSLKGTWTDIGGGTWTGTLADGTTTITLKVTGGATVDDAAVTLETGFSLDGLDDGGMGAASFMFQHDGELPTLDAMLAQNAKGESDTTSFSLPDTDADDGDGMGVFSPSDAPSQNSDASGYTPLTPDALPLNDELEDSLTSAYTMG